MWKASWVDALDNGIVERELRVCKDSGRGMLITELI